MITHGASKTKLYSVYMSMRDRCSRKKSKQYKDYGGKGVVVMFTCFEDFRDWALKNGYSENLSIDRIDGDGPYSRDNCRWATRKVQNRNRKMNVFITHPETGERLCKAEWSERLGGHNRLVKERLEAGWPPEKAITVPLDTEHKLKRRIKNEKRTCISTKQRRLYRAD